ncbi:hypothetical protein O181_028303 [Austropuccinia psidii MF-1]|uniref:AAA+ ATPase domain-containing protein n=1 Tax=Austropuccinia psidii MF-1 TaxID=1389203 RepID=A0A9Q3H1P4_9BASI|nr:hypothetical protein [Austropuccinia psidii MF-1]
MQNTPKKCFIWNVLAISRTKMRLRVSNFNKLFGRGKLSGRSWPEFYQVGSINSSNHAPKTKMAGAGVDPLEVDESFIDLLSQNHSLIESAQAKALLDDGDLEGEAAAAIRSHQAFEEFGFSLSAANGSAATGISTIKESLGSMLEFDDDFLLDDDGDQLMKHPETNQSLTGGGGLDSLPQSENIINLPPALPSTLGEAESENIDLEIDHDFDSFIKPASSSVKTMPSIADNILHAQAKQIETNRTLSLELDDAFQNQNYPDSTFEASRQKLKQATSRRGPSLDNMIAEAENDEGNTLPSNLLISSLPNPSAIVPSPHFTSTSSHLPTLDEIENNLPRPRWISTTFLIATQLDGTKIQIPRRKRIGQTHFRSSRSAAGLKKQCLELLDEPIHRMLAKVQEEVVHKQPLVPTQEGIAPLNSLWTDRYRPKKFIDLVGDERVFRSAMGWLKSWDQCVFKRSAKSRHLQSKSQSNFSTEAELDPYGRPDAKVLLLCGKPGLGKTTMAEVLATQAGYQVIEINASDDRSSKTVTDRIQSALETRSLDLGAKNGGGLTLKNNRPCCVIIDEIDGAGGGGGGGNEGGFVRALVKLVTEGSTVRKSAMKGKKLDHMPLRRPIICICNDLYAPVLRPLRPIARIIRFNAPSSTTIIKRLQSICRIEHLTADLQNLNYLVKLASGDLRSCLNTLQFVKTQTNVVTDRTIKSAAGVGMKDSGSSVQAVLTSLFKISAKKSSNRSEQTDQRDLYLSNLVRDISTCGQNERIIQGCFEAYLNMKPPTDQWATYCQLHDWLNFYDILETKIWTDQAYQLSGYVPYSIAAWREFIASISNKAPEYPKVDYEIYQKRLANEEVLASFNQSLPAQLKACFKTREVICELMPFLTRIISVDLRPMNSQLHKEDDRRIMTRIVEIMLGLSLNFVQDRGEDGQLTYVLEPQIDFSTIYEGKRATDIPPPRFAARQLIDKEMTAVKIRFQGGPSGGLRSGATAILEAYNRNTHPARKSKEAVVAALDFFGRAIVNAGPITLPNTQERRAIEKVKVAYRFHEGFSNAVKKPITFKEFIFK